MAFNTDTPSSNKAGNGNGNGNGNRGASGPANDNWMAQGFLNLYLPGENGRKKLGAIPLKDARKNERDLRAWLVEDPDRVKIILSKLEIEYQSATETSGFKLED